jgi:hypothetical protein
VAQYWLQIVAHFALQFNTFNSSSSSFFRLVTVETEKGEDLANTPRAFVRVRVVINQVLNLDSQSLKKLEN